VIYPCPEIKSTCGLINLGTFVARVASGTLVARCALGTLVAWRAMTLESTDACRHATNVPNATRATNVPEKGGLAGGADSVGGGERFAGAALGADQVDRLGEEERRDER